MPNGKSNTETQEEKLARLERENQQLRAEKANPGLSCQVSVKGGLSVYGLGRFPVTLYVEQWERLATYMPDVMAFIGSHGDRLARKS